MKSVHLTDLMNDDYSLRHVIAHMQYWRAGSTWLIQEGGRINTAVMAMVGVEADYVDVETREVLASAMPGDLVVIPQGIRYEFITRNVDNGGRSVGGLPGDNYYLDGIKIKNEEEDRSRTANAIFLGFEMFASDGEPITLGSRIHVMRLPRNETLFQQSEQLARMSGIGFTPPALITARMYELLTLLSEVAFNKRPQSSAYRRIEPALRYIDKQPVGSISVNELSEICGLSSSGFRRLFKQEMGISPIEYVQKRTISRAMELLGKGELSITEVALECGFQDAFYFSRFFRRQTGTSPSGWRQTYMGTCQ